MLHIKVVFLCISKLSRTTGLQKQGRQFANNTFKARHCNVTPALIEHSDVKQWWLIVKQSGAVTCMRACGMGSNQQDGYLPTGRAGDTTMEGWIHKRNKIGHKHTNKQTDTHAHRTTEEEQNKQSKIRHKKKEIKVRTNDMLCWGQHISAKGKHDRDDSVAFVHWTVFSCCLGQSFCFSRPTVITGVVEWAPTTGQQCSMLFRDKCATGSSLLALMKSKTLRVECICNCKAKMCLSLVLMYRAEKREEEEVRKRKSLKTTCGLNSGLLKPLYCIQRSWCR